MKTLREYVLEALSMEKRVVPEPYFILEGIDIDKTRKRVSITDFHQKHVDTSVEDNPTVDNVLLPGVEVWSVFKRSKRIDKTDGNPLIYALKREEGWTFCSRSDEERLLARIKEVMNKYISAHKHCTALIVPSTNVINNLLGKIYQEQDPAVKIIKNIWRKMTTDEVYEYLVNTDDTEFRKKFGQNENAFNRALDAVEGFLDKMDEKNGGVFSYHEIKDAELRNAICKTLTAEDPKTYGLYAADINGKDVLVIDDAISRGSTIKQAVDIVRGIFKPKSISVLTLFSAASK